MNVHIINSLNKSIAFQNHPILDKMRISGSSAAPTPQTVQPPSQKKNKNILLYSSIAAGVLLAVFAIAKRKNISEFASNIFKGKKLKEPEAVPASKLSVVVPKSLLETFTDELSSIQKELDSSVNTKNMKFGDLIELVDKNLPYDDESIPLHLKQKFVKIENEAKEKNISFVTSPKFTCGQENLEQFIKEKMDYVQKLGGCISTNEATAIEALDWIEKNGIKGNYSIYKGVYGSLIDEVTASFRILKDDGRMTDKALNKYIGLYDKFAETPLKGDKWGDAVDLGKVFEENASLMSKETAFKFLDAIEKIAFRRLDVHVVKLYSEDLKLNLNPKDFEEFVSRIDKLENSFKKK